MPSKKFRYFRFLRFALLSLLPILLLCVLITRQSHKWASDILRQNAADMLDKNVALIDQRLSSIVTSIHLLDRSEELCLLFANATDTPRSILNVQRALSDIYNRYFFDLSGMESICLVTPFHTFHYFDRNPLPQESYTQFSAYEELSQSDGKIVWYPTYNLAKGLKAADYVGSRIDQYDVFSVGKRLTLTYFKRDVPYKLSEDGVHPVLFIHFSPDFFRAMLSADHLLTDTEYVVYTQGGDIVYTSGDAPPLPAADMPASSIGKIGTTELQDAEGHSYYVCHTQLTAGSGWLVASFTPIKAAYSFFSDSLYVIIMVVLLITTLYCTVMVFLSTRSLALPMRLLSDAIKRTSSGDFAYRIETGRYPDFQELFSCYNRMNTQITQLIRENYEIKLSEKNLEIQVINLQFNPHFLYNTLNIISLMTLSRGQGDISDMIHALAYMMRYSIKTPQGLVPFEKDLEYTDAYVSLMQLRMDQPFLYEKQIDEALMGITVPKLLLQPFIENAILHGFTDSSPHPALYISGSIRDGDVFFTVSDNGQGMTQENIDRLWSQESTSLGVKNTHHRIRLYYGDAYGVRIDSRPQGGTRVLIHIALAPRFDVSLPGSAAGR